MIEDRLRDGFGLLYVGEVCGVRDNSEARVGDRFADKFRLVRRGGRIIGAGDNEGGDGDCTESSA